MQGKREGAGFKGKNWHQTPLFTPRRAGKIHDQPERRGGKGGNFQVSVGEERHLGDSRIKKKRNKGRGKRNRIFFCPQGRGENSGRGGRCVGSTLGNSARPSPEERGVFIRKNSSI